MAGWQPICSDRFDYEMTIMLVLPEGAKGVPDMNARTTKILEEHISFIPSKREINEETGKRLAEWANQVDNKVINFDEDIMSSFSLGMKQ